MDLSLSLSLYIVYMYRRLGCESNWELVFFCLRVHTLSLVVEWKFDSNMCNCLPWEPFPFLLWHHGEFQ